MVSSGICTRVVVAYAAAVVVIVVSGFSEHSYV